MIYILLNSFIIIQSEYESKDSLLKLLSNLDLEELNQNMNNFENDDPEHNLTDLMKFGLDVFNVLIDEILNNSNISKSCNKTFSVSFNNYNNLNLSLGNALKVAIDSSKNKNDLSYYTYCQNNEYLQQGNISDNFTFIISKFRKTDGYNNLANVSKHLSKDFFIDNIKYKQGPSIFGLCLPKENCHEDDYKKIIKNALLIFEKLLNKDNSFEVENIYILEKNESPNFPKFIPLILLLIIPVIVLFFTLIPSSILNNFLKRLTEDKKGRQLKKFFKSFTLFKNMEELFNYSLIKSEINDETGIIYIKGVRGISMIFLVFGSLYYNIMNSRLMNLDLIM